MRVGSKASFDSLAHSPRPRRRRPYSVWWLWDSTAVIILQTEQGQTVFPVVEAVYAKQVQRTTVSVQVRRMALESGRVGWARVGRYCRVALCAGFSAAEWRGAAQGTNPVWNERLDFRRVPEPEHSHGHAHPLEIYVRARRPPTHTLYTPLGRTRART